ncbi:thiol peroxidase [Serratia ureilytica]
MTQTVHFQGNPVSVAATASSRANKPSAFSLVAKDLSDVALSSFAGKRKVLNIFPSIDTGVCATSVRKFNQLASGTDNTVVLCISADLPFAQPRFCGAEGLSNVVTLSTLRSAEFKQAYGVENRRRPVGGPDRACSRGAGWRDNVLYSELVNEITTEPDYTRRWLR